MTVCETVVTDTQHTPGEVSPSVFVSQRRTGGQPNDGRNPRVIRFPCPHNHLLPSRGGSRYRRSFGMHYASEFPICSYTYV